MADTSDDLDVTYHRAQGRIDRLEVDNFKSYKGHQQIGPFKNFTAIIGPNGSGKSNLMDAISFVLGVRTQQLRGSLKELLYSNSGASNAAAKPRKGFVKLVYETDAGDEVHFSRIIQPTSSDPDGNYQSVYKINDKTVTWEAYSKKLSGFGILVKVRNFLVFQVSIIKRQGCINLADYMLSCQAVTNCDAAKDAPAQFARLCDSCFVGSERSEAWHACSEHTHQLSVLSTAHAA